MNSESAFADGHAVAIRSASAPPPQKRASPSPLRLAPSQARPRRPGGHGIAKARHALNAPNALRAAHDRARAPERWRSLRPLLTCVGRSFGALERRLGQPDRLSRPPGLFAFGRPV